MMFLHLFRPFVSFLGQQVHFAYVRNLAGGFKYFLFSPLFGEGFQFD